MPVKKPKKISEFETIIGSKSFLSLAILSSPSEK